ncbi:hypothetical protein [Actinomadura sp. 3N508]|uniref:hypothetical protein n=1 Tax=Actinomadura sp. 3N508 TaxID=3375153 RepID=UPI0037B71163
MEDLINAQISLNTQGASGWLTGFTSGKEGVSLTVTTIPGPWVYEVEGRLVNGRASITRVAIVPRDPENPTPITKDVVRRTPIGTVLAWVKGALRTEWEDRFRKLAAATSTHTAKQGRSWPAEHYLQVAWFAVNAELTERPGGPRQAIVDHWGVEKITASRWMAKARELGYLPTYLAPPSHPPQSDIDAQFEATRRLEEAIFDKVLRSGLTQGPGQDTSTAAQLVLNTLMGTSPEAAQIRGRIFIDYLADLIESPDKQIRDAAERFLNILDSEVDSE